MIKLGRLIKPVFHQICQQHLLQLAINDLIYDKKEIILKYNLEEIFADFNVNDGLETSKCEFSENEEEENIPEPSAKKRKLNNDDDNSETEEDLVGLLKKIDSDSITTSTNNPALKIEFNKQVELVRKVVNLKKKYKRRIA